MAAMQTKTGRVSDFALACGQYDDVTHGDLLSTLYLDGRTYHILTVDDANNRIHERAGNITEARRAFARHCTLTTIAQGE